jgi:hypothetical protein
MRGSRCQLSLAIGDALVLVKQWINRIQQDRTHHGDHWQEGFDHGSE